MNFASSRLRVQLLKPTELTAAHISLWKRIVQQNSSLDNPQLQPEFALALELSGRPIEVAVLETDIAVVGFFPFARLTASRAEPIGGITSDQEALIVASDTKLNMARVLRACGLTRWSFGHLDAIQSASFAKAAYLDDCYSANLELGYASWNCPRKVDSGAAHVRLL